jgi:hypothetical protein
MKSILVKIPDAWKTSEDSRVYVGDRAVGVMHESIPIGVGETLSISNSPLQLTVPPENWFVHQWSSYPQVVYSYIGSSVIPEDVLELLRYLYKVVDVVDNVPIIGAAGRGRFPVFDLVKSTPPEPKSLSIDNLSEEEWKKRVLANLRAAENHTCIHQPPRIAMLQELFCLKLSPSLGVLTTALSDFIELCSRDSASCEPTMRPYWNFPKRLKEGKELIKKLYQ